MYSVFRVQLGDKSDSRLRVLSTPEQLVLPRPDVHPPPRHSLPFLHITTSASFPEWNVTLPPISSELGEPFELPPSNTSFELVEVPLLDTTSRSATLTRAITPTTPVILPELIVLQDTMSGPRTPFTPDEDRFLMKYIAVYNPDKPGRMGNALYRRLVDNAGGKWPWSKRHSWQSWRERYKDNEYRFDAAIRKYQQKKGIRRAGDGLGVTQGVSASPVSSPRESPTGEKAVQAGRPDSDRPREGTSKSGPSSTQNPTTSQISAPEQSQVTNHETAGQDRNESEETAVSRRQTASGIRKPVARKTARKTVVVVDHYDEEGEEEPEEGEIIESVGEEERGVVGKRKADELRAPVQAKRRRVEEGELIEADVPKESAPAATASSASNGSQANGIPTVKNPVSRPLELLASFNQNGKTADEKKTWELLMKLLDSKPEEKQQVIEFAKSRLSEIPASSLESENTNTQSQELLYPRLEEEDYNPTSIVEPTDNVPGSWQNAEKPATSTPAERSQRESEPSQMEARPAEGSQLAQEADQQRTSVTNNKPAPQPRNGVSDKIPEEDFFRTPSPSPSPAKADKMVQSSPVQPVESPSPKMRQTGTAIEKDHADERIQLSKRDLPQYTSGPFRSAFTPSHKHVLSPGQAPDVDTDSDSSGTDIVPEDEMPVKVMNKPQAPSQSWPPLRQKKSTEGSSPQAEKVVVQPPVPPVQKPTRVAPIAKAPILMSKTTPAAEPRPKAASKAPPAPVRGPSHEIFVSPVEPQKGATKKGQAIHLKAVSQPEPEVGPSKLQGSALQVMPVERAGETDNIHAWRSETHISNNGDDVSATTVSDPFLTTEHAKILRQQQKGKGKEGVTVVSETPTAEAEARANRRMTFGGFSASKPPEIDLRRRALRSSIAGNQLPSHRRLSFSPSVMLARDEKEDNHVAKKTHRTSVRTSVNATFDLSQEFPSPQIEIPPTDRTYMLRAGAQVLIQAIAQNHSVSEKFVRDIYEELLDLRATDRVVAKMRKTAEESLAKEMEHEKQIKRRSSAASLPLPESELRMDSQPHASMSPRSSPEKQETDVSTNSASRSRSISAGRPSELITERKAEREVTPPPRRSPVIRHRTTSTSVWSSPERPGPDVSVVSAAEARTLSGRRRSELFITPADEDPTYVRLREQYVPPSASRAARFVRHRARRSSGLASSPLNGYDESMQVDEEEDEKEEEKEEEEVTMALTPAQEQAIVLTSSDSEDEDAGNGNVSRSARKVADLRRVSSGQRESASTTNVQPWTAEEDDILRGEDEDAIEEIIKQKGALSVRLRMAELAQ